MHARLMLLAVALATLITLETNASGVGQNDGDGSLVLLRAQVNESLNGFQQHRAAATTKVRHAVEALLVQLEASERRQSQLTAMAARNSADSAGWQQELKRIADSLQRTAASISTSTSTTVRDANINNNSAEMIFPPGNSNRQLSSSTPNVNLYVDGICSCNSLLIDDDSVVVGEALSSLNESMSALSESVASAVADNEDCPTVAATLDLQKTSTFNALLMSVPLQVRLTPNGQHAVVAAGTVDSVVIVNVTDPFDLKFEGFAQDNALLDGPFDVVLSASGDFAYATAAAAGNLVIIDIRTPVDPTIVGHAEVGSSPRQLCLSHDGALAFVTTEAGVVVVNVTNKTHPLTVGPGFANSSFLDEPAVVALSSDGQLLCVCVALLLSTKV